MYAPGFSRSWSSLAVRTFVPSHHSTFLSTTPRLLGTGAPRCASQRPGHAGAAAGHARPRPPDRARAHAARHRRRPRASPRPPPPQPPLTRPPRRRPPPPPPPPPAQHRDAPRVGARARDRGGAPRARATVRVGVRDRVRDRITSATASCGARRPLVMPTPPRTSGGGERSAKGRWTANGSAEGW